MSLHQIIYTSCMRGINGVNDGQQVFSYDASFKDANNDEVKSLFSYQPPALEPGVIMTEEIANTLPKSFTYRKLDNGACALALNTYLGRDYMGSAGRYGNHLSHVIIADESDMQNYPCEFYGSSLLRDHMEFEEVNNPNRPDFLPEPVLERGFTVDIDTVIDFLSVDDRIEIFKNMLHAVLAFETAFVTRDRDYSQQYGDQILNDYYRRLESSDSESAYDAKLDFRKNKCAICRKFSERYC